MDQVNKNPDQKINSSNYFLDNQDILFQIRDKIDLNEVKKFIDETYLSLLIKELTELGKICAEVSTCEVDNDSSKILKLQHKIQTMKLFSYDREAKYSEESRPYSNKQVPFLLRCVALELLSRASPTLFMRIYTRSLCDYIITTYASSDIYKKLYSDGRTFIDVAFAFTEKEGSDLSDIKTQAVEGTNGTVEITGQKTLILNAQEASYFIVLAESKAPGSIPGLKLYLVDAGNLDDKSLVKIKLASKISYKTYDQYELRFNKARAYPLVTGKDSSIIIQDLLNQSRLSDAFCALGMLEGSKQLAFLHTSKRSSWHRQLSKHESVIEKLLDISVSTIGFRSFCYEAAYYYSYLTLARSVVSDRGIKKKDPGFYSECRSKIKSYNKLIKLWLPVLKWWAAEEVPSNILQVFRLHGGHGLLTSCDIQVYLRDSLALRFQNSPAHIQAILTTKYVLKSFIKKPSAYLCFRPKDLFSFKFSYLSRKLSSMNRFYRRTIFALVSSITVSKIWYKLSFLDYLNIGEIASIIKKNIASFTDTKGILVHGEKLTKMQGILLICSCLLKDYGIQEKHDSRVRKYFESRFSLEKNRGNSVNNNDDYNGKKSDKEGKKSQQESRQEIQRIKDSLVNLRIGSKLNLSSIFSLIPQNKGTKVNLEEHLLIRKQDIVKRFLFKYSHEFYSLGKKISSKDEVITSILRSSYYDEEEDNLSEWKGF